MVAISRHDALAIYEQVRKDAPVAPKKPFISAFVDVNPELLRKTADLLEAYEKDEAQYKLLRVSHATRVKEAIQQIENALVAEYPGCPKEAILHIWKFAENNRPNFSEALEYYDELMELATTFRRMTQQK